MVPQAMRFDVEETLMDRTQSIGQYAARFQRDFAAHVAPIAVPTIAATILTADERGSRPHDALCGDLLPQLLWQTPLDVVRLHAHWETWCPASSVTRAGLKATLTTLHAQGMRLGVVTNGVVRRQQPTIAHLHMRPSLSTVVISEAVQVKKPDPRICARALAEVGCEAPQAWCVGDHPVHDVCGAGAVGLRPMWLRGGYPWPPDHPAPPWQIGALPALGELVHQERTPAT